MTRDDSADLIENSRNDRSRAGLMQCTGVGVINLEVWRANDFGLSARLMESNSVLFDKD